MDIISSFINIPNKYTEQIIISIVPLVDYGWVRTGAKLGSKYCRDPFPYGHMDYLHKVLFF